MAEHNILGKKGEELAAKYLAENGYTIIQKNWRVGKLEIDLIATKSNVLVIIEVKTRSTSYFEAPEEAINNKKIRNIINATEAYIHLEEWDGETRFDVISIIPTTNNFKIEHIEDAFIAPINF